MPKTKKKVLKKRGLCFCARGCLRACIAAIPLQPSSMLSLSAASFHFIILYYIHYKQQKKTILTRNILRGRRSCRGRGEGIHGDGGGSSSDRSRVRATARVRIIFSLDPDRIRLSGKNRADRKGTERLFLGHRSLFSNNNRLRP